MSPSDPGFAERVRTSFLRQTLMTTLGASLEEVEPGRVAIRMKRQDGILQQHGFVHGGAVTAIADTAAGYAALTLLPPGRGVMSVEFKINFMRPAAQSTILAIGNVLKPGRTLSVAQAEVFGEEAGKRTTIALLIATMMAVEGRDGVVD